MQAFHLFLMILLSSVSILDSAVALSALLKNLQIFSENEKILPNYKMATLGTKNVHSALMTIISNRRNWDVYWKIAPLIMLFDPSDLWLLHVTIATFSYYLPCFGKFLKQNIISYLLYNIYFGQITTFIKVCVAFTFKLETL